MLNYQKTIKESRNILIGSAVALAIVAGGIISTPFIRSAYKGHKAQDLITQTSDSISGLEKEVNEVSELVKSNEFILFDDEETKLYGEINDSKRKASDLKKVLDENRNLFESKSYDDIRRSLDSQFDLEKGNTRTTPLNISQSERNDIKNVVVQVSSKRKSRDEVITNEGELVSRLASPLAPGMVERKEKHQFLTTNQYQQIPTLTQELESRLSTIEPELNNSLGVALLEHEPTLEHILATAKAERIKQKSTNLFNETKENYLNVRPLNDSLSIWYKADKNDGTFSQVAYDALLAEQIKPLGFINQGDNLLRELDDYNQELHDQYYIYVSEHNKTPKTFHHTRLVPVTRIVTKTRMKSDGGMETYTDTESDIEIEHYTTIGYSYSFTQARVSPYGTTSEEVFVGEKDNTWFDWAYTPEQQVGYLIEWKQLHNDNLGIVPGGHIERVKPFIEKE